MNKVQHSKGAIAQTPNGRTPRRLFQRRTLGASLMESVIVVVLIAIFAGVGGLALINFKNTGIENAKNANAQHATQLASAAIQAGATVGSGATFNIDTTSGQTAITCLNNGFQVAGITFKMSPSVGTPGSYTLAAASATGVVFGYTTGLDATP